MTPQRKNYRLAAMARKRFKVSGQSRTVKNVRRCQKILNQWNRLCDLESERRENRKSKKGKWIAAQYRKNEVSHHATWLSRYQSHDDSEYLTGSMDIHGKDILK